MNALGKILFLSFVIFMADRAVACGFSDASVAAEAFASGLAKTVGAPSLRLGPAGASAGAKDFTFPFAFEKAGIVSVGYVKVSGDSNCIVGGYIHGSAHSVPAAP